MPALGFQLLAPVQCLIAWQGYSSARHTRARQFALADRKLQFLGTALASATTPRELRDALVSQHGFELNPAVLEQPFEPLKKDLQRKVQDTRKQVARQREQVLSRWNPWQLVRRSARIALSSLFYGLAFATGRTLRPDPPFTSRPHGNAPLRRLRPVVILGKSRKSADPFGWCQCLPQPPAAGETPAPWPCWTPGRTPSRAAP